MLSLLLYTTIFIFSYLCIDYSEKKHLSIIGYSGCFFSILLMGLRYEIGTDWHNYEEIFNVCRISPISFLLSKTNDPGFYILTKIIGYFGNYRFMIFIITFLTFFLVYASLDKSKRSSAFILYLLLVMPVCMTALKQGISIAILLISFNNLKKKQLTAFILSVLAAALFHTSALLVLPLYLINFMPKEYINTVVKASPILLLVMTPAIRIILSFLVTLLNYIPSMRQYTRYFQLEEGTFNLGFYLNISVFVICLLFHKQLLRISKFNYLYFFLFTMENVCFFMGYLSPTTKRFAYYFTIGQIYLLADFPRIFRTPRQRALVKTLILVYAFMSFYIHAIRGHNAIIPYRIFA